MYHPGVRANGMGVPGRVDRVDGGMPMSTSGFRTLAANFPLFP